MLFIEDSSGEKVATATAFYDSRDTSGAGWLPLGGCQADTAGKGPGQTPYLQGPAQADRTWLYRTLKFPPRQIPGWQQNYIWTQDLSRKRKMQSAAGTDTGF